MHVFSPGESSPFWLLVLAPAPIVVDLLRPTLSRRARRRPTWKRPS
jgi:hypothetical protein